MTEYGSIPGAVEFCQAVVDGFYVQVQLWQVLAAKKEGRLVLGVSPDEFLRKPGDREPDDTWVTITEAAKMHMADSPGTDLEEAKKRVTRAVDRGKIRAAGQKRNRLIDPGVGTLADFRLQYRDADLAKEEDDE